MLSNFPKFNKKALVIMTDNEEKKENIEANEIKPEQTAQMQETTEAVKNELKTSNVEQKTDIPAGFNKDGLPIGLQVIGRPNDDFGVLQLAHAYEQESRALTPAGKTPVLLRRPSIALASDAQ